MLSTYNGKIISLKEMLKIVVVIITIFIVEKIFIIFLELQYISKEEQKVFQNNYCQF